MTSITVDQNKDYNAIRRLSIRARNPFECSLDCYCRHVTESNAALLGACGGSPGGEQEQKDPPPEFHGLFLSPDAGGKSRQGGEKTDFELDAPRRAGMPWKNPIA